MKKNLLIALLGILTSTSLFSQVSFYSDAIVNAKIPSDTIEKQEEIGIKWKGNNSFDICNFLELHFSYGILSINPNSPFQKSVKYAEDNQLFVNYGYFRDHELVYVFLRRYDSSYMSVDFIKPDESERYSLFINLNNFTKSSQ